MKKNEYYSDYTLDLFFPNFVFKKIARNDEAKILYCIHKYKRL